MVESKDLLYEAYLCDAKSTMNFKIIRTFKDIETEDLFHPQFTHQFFGENEKIFGYKNLNVSLYFSAGNLIPYLSVKYDKRLSSDDTYDIENVILEKLPDAHRSLESFREAVQEDNFNGFGTIVKQYTKDGRSFEIYHAIGADISRDSFRIYSSHLQYLLLYFVDGSSFIDISDSEWEYFIVCEKYIDSDFTEKRATVGFLTAYNFFAYPDNIRQRISQVLILPNFQRQGHGTELLQAFYGLALSNPKIKDVTVEDPSDQFQQLRDFVDCRNILTTIDFRKEMLKFENFSEFSDLIKRKLKLNSKQIMRIFEILGLKFLDKSNVSDGMKFKVMVIRRLNGLFGKTKDFDSISAQSYLTMSTEQKGYLIEREFERLEQCYFGIVNKLDG